MPLTIDEAESLFEGQEAEQLRANEAILAYIRYLASISNNDISRWSPTMFLDGETKNLIQDKNEINRIFFEKLEKSYNRKKNTEAKIEEIKDFQPLVNDFINRYIKDKALSCERSAEQYAAYARENFQAAEDNLRNATVKRTEAAAMREGEKTFQEKIKKEVGKILKDGCWVNPIVDMNKKVIWFNTASDVMMSYKNTAAGIDVDVNCGQLAVMVGLAQSQIWVLPYKNNRTFVHRGYYYFHPHVDPNGVVCWGNVKPQIAEQLPKMELAKVMEMLYSLLFNYCDHQPHISIQDLKINGIPYDWETMLSPNNYHPEIPAFIKEKREKLKEEGRRDAEAEAKRQAEVEARTNVVQEPGQPENNPPQNQ